MSGISGAPTELGTLKISKLLKMYAVPGIIAMTASSLYNMVDSIFIGHIGGVGSYAISGLAVTFPLMNLAAALGTLVGIGGSTMISVLLGQRNYKTASRVLGNTVTLNIILGALFAIGCLLFLRPILYFFGASENTISFARDYMVIILLGNVITHLYFGFNGVLRSSGHPRTAMGLTIFTVVSNAILDPVFIFVFKLGIKGAALATVLCQLMALVYSTKFLNSEKSVLHFPKKLSLDWRIAKSSLAIGMGPFLMNCASCIVALFINQQLRKYGGDLSIGAYGIVNRITFMFVMIVMGLNQGLQPIAGYNYGARQYSRVREVYFLTVKWALLVTSVCFAVSMLFPRQAVSIFTSDAQMRELAADALFKMNVAFAIVGIPMITSTFFQCLGMVKKSIVLSLTRQLLFFVPLVYTLPTFWGENGVWASFPISDVLATALAAIMVISLLKKLGRLSDGDDPSSIGSNL